MAGRFVTPKQLGKAVKDIDRMDEISSRVYNSLIGKKVLSEDGRVCEIKSINRLGIMGSDSVELMCEGEDYSEWSEIALLRARRK